MADISLFTNISNIHKRISHAAIKAGRSPEDIKLIAVTKNVAIERIKQAADAGLRIFGENRVQEAREKIEAARYKMHDTDIQWHLIGHLQKNKARLAVELFDFIHSVDSTELAEALNKHAEKMGKTQEIIIQVKLSHEESKSGISKDNLMGLVEDISIMKNLRLNGLMTIPPFFDDPEMSRPYFRDLRELRGETQAKGFNLPALSMGMTNDFEVAIEEGATMVRIGTAIFGGRRKEAL